MAPSVPLYVPLPTLRTQLDDFHAFLNDYYNLQLSTYHELHEFSIKQSNAFWMAFWQFAGVKASKHPSKAIDDNAAIDDFPAFFEDARLNFAENLLHGRDDDVAVIEMNEQNMHSPEKYTWKQLRQLVARYAGVLERAGVTMGDVVVVVGGNSARSLALMLAAASRGSMFSSFATEIGEKALNDRLQQLLPKLLIAELVYCYNGSTYDVSEQVLRCFRTLEQKHSTQLIVSYCLPDQHPTLAKLDALVSRESASSLTFAQVSFSTPFVVMFSSGTTGLPKGIVHSQGGLLLNGLKEHLLHNDFGPHDIHFHYSGIGWTLWNISLGALLCGSTMLLYDGAPSYPSHDRFLRAVFKTGVTAFGCGPRYISELQKRGVRPREYAPGLRSVLSTGALLTPGAARWLAEAFGPVCQINFSGGTELCGSFMTGVLTMPSYAGEIAVKALGMDVDAFDNAGRSVPDGEAGELVCKKPFPNMPIALWNDADNSRYRKSYFTQFPGVWTHGDLIRVDAQTKGIYVLGRSDGVLNPSGVRFGTSDLYNVLSHPEIAEDVLDSIAVGQQRVVPPYSDPTERVILFLKMSSRARTKTISPRGALVERIWQHIGRDLSKRHIPTFIFEVGEIPYNANGKKMEIQLKAVCNHGGDVLATMKLTEKERKVLGDYTRFFHVESLFSPGKVNL